MWLLDEASSSLGTRVPTGLTPPVQWGQWTPVAGALIQ